MTEDRIFSTVEAAAYTSLAVPTIKHHLYKTKLLKPDRILGGALVFTQATLDAFIATSRKSGAKPGSKWSRNREAERLRTYGGTSKRP